MGQTGKSHTKRRAAETRLPQPLPNRAGTALTKVALRLRDAAGSLGVSHNARLGRAMRQPQRVPKLMDRHATYSLLRAKGRDDAGSPGTVRKPHDSPIWMAMKSR